MGDRGLMVYTVMRSACITRMPYVRQKEHLRAELNRRTHVL
jgi:hypothetical protein